jgi:hypothetical protein
MAPQGSCPWRLNLGDVDVPVAERIGFYPRIGRPGSDAMISRWMPSLGLPAWSLSLTAEAKGLYGCLVLADPTNDPRCASASKKALAPGASSDAAQRTAHSKHRDSRPNRQPVHALTADLGEPYLEPRDRTQNPSPSSPKPQFTQVASLFPRIKLRTRDQKAPIQEPPRCFFCTPGLESIFSHGLTDCAKLFGVRGVAAPHITPKILEGLWLKNHDPGIT